MLDLAARIAVGITLMIIGTIVICVATRGIYRTRRNLENLYGTSARVAAAQLLFWILLRGLAGAISFGGALFAIHPEIEFDR